MKTKNKLLPICVIGVAFLLGLSVWSAVDGEAFGSDISANNADKLKAFAALQVKKSELQSKLGTNSIYPEFSSSIEEEKLLDKSEATAINTAEKALIEREALYWYAVNHGIQLTDEEVQQRIEAAIADAKKAENYDEIAAACKAAGTTFEATMLENKEFYKKEYTNSDLYNAKLSAFSEGKNGLDGEQLSAWESYWDNFVDTTISEYKLTRNYTVLESAIATSKELVKKDITDLSRIKASETSQSHP